MSEGFSPDWSGFAPSSKKLEEVDNWAGCQEKINTSKQITFGEVRAWKFTFEEQVLVCSIVNRDIESYFHEGFDRKVVCHRKNNGHTICDSCPKYFPKDTDFTTCPDCGCVEALITAVGIGEDKGKLQVFCPQEQKYKVVKA